MTAKDAAATTTTTATTPISRYGGELELEVVVDMVVEVVG
jgi:hypothetical protein